MRGFRGEMACEGLERGGACERVLRRGIFRVGDAFGFGAVAF